MKRKVNPTLPESGPVVDEDSRQRFRPKPKNSWRKLIGRTKDDDLSPEAFRLGAEWRDRMNAQGH